MSPSGNIRLRRLLAQLKRFDVGHNRPAVRWYNLRRIVRHGTVAVRNHMKEVAQWRRLKPCRMEAAGLGIPALHNHPNPIAHARVARRAVNVVTLLSTLEHLHGDGKGHSLALFTIGKPSVEVAVFV